MPCQRGLGSGHSGKQTGPPGLRLLTQRTGRPPCEQRGGECQGEGGSPLEPPLPAGACCGGPAPLRAGPRKTTQPVLSSQNSPPEPCSSLRRSRASWGPYERAQQHICPSPLTDTQPAGRAHGHLSSRLWRGQACGLPLATTLHHCSVAVKGKNSLLSE